MVTSYTVFIIHFCLFFHQNVSHWVWTGTIFRIFFNDCFFIRNYFQMWCTSFTFTFTSCDIMRQFSMTKFQFEQNIWWPMSIEYVPYQWNIFRNSNTNQLHLKFKLWPFHTAGTQFNSKIVSLVKINENSFDIISDSINTA